MHRVLDASNLPSASIFINIVRALIWVLALLSVMRPVFGVDPAGFVAALGVVSLAVSLGMQDTIANIISGISLMVSKSVQPGDYITVNGITGEVTDVTWRSTTVRMRGGAEEVIPNSVLSKTSLTKLPPANLVVVPFAVTSTGAPLAEDAERIAQATETAVAAVSPIISDPPVKVLFSDITEYGFRGKAIATIEDPALVAAAIDAAVRAIAPLTR